MRVRSDILAKKHDSGVWRWSCQKVVPGLWGCHKPGGGVTSSVELGLSQARGGAVTSPVELSQARGGAVTSSW